MKLIFFSIVILFITCNEHSGSKNKLPDKPTHDDTLKSKLIGKWGDFENPMWDIRMDSIYYFERSTAYLYKISNNDLIIYLPESKGILRNIHVIKDTLFFLDEQGLIVKGYRFKNKKN